MNKKTTLLLSVFLCITVGSAYGAPTFGLWEQLVVTQSKSEKARTRRNFIFLDSPLTEDTVFSAVSDAYNGTICCLKVTERAPVPIGDFISRYEWDADDIEHLKSIKGLSYIYEAKLVDSAEQNGNMRDLVNMTVRPEDLSPFSAAVVSGGEDKVNRIRGKLNIDGISAKFSSTYDDQRNALRYIFSYKGKQTVFWEKPFAAE